MKLAEDVTETLHEPEVEEHKMCASIHFKFPQQRLIKCSFRYFHDSNTGLNKTIGNSISREELFRGFS